ncbi:MAG TPA: acetylxylan esterase, partial [Galbitalea sp.]|nr:acetylxylan esterase [Galbitalea sp.]
MLVDLDGDELLAYRSDQKDPPDFDRFWARTLGEARGFDSSAQLALMDSPINGVDIFDMSFSGYGGQRISAWLRTPKAIDAQLPVIVEFVGYGGGRGFAEDSLFWSACGFAHLQMDTRGQGATWSVGSTPDVATAGPRVPGMMTSGIENRDDYYYRRLITDAVRAIDAVRTIEFIDPARITSFGVSQGGGLALAAAALVPEVSSLATYLPFLCDFPRAILVTDSD